MKHKLYISILCMLGLGLNSLAARAQEDPLTLMYTELEPYVIISNGEASGFVAEQLNQAAAAVQIPIVWRHVHWDRQIPLLKDNKASLCAVGLYKTNDRETFMRFSAPLGFDAGLVLVGLPHNEKLKKHKRFDSLVSDQTLKPILQQHSVYSPYVDKLIDGKNFPTTKGSLERISRTLKSGKHDYMIVTRPTAENLRDRNGLKIYDHYEDLSDKIPYYLTCSLKTDAELFSRLNRAIIAAGPISEK